MTEFTRDQFKKIFGVSPGKLFDLNKILTEQHRIEAMRLPNPSLSRMRAECGTLKAPGKPTLIYCLHISYWIESGRFRASIRKVIIFDSQSELDLHRIEMQVKEPNWNDN